MFAPKDIKAEPAPEFAGKPAGTPLAGVAQRHGPEMDADDGKIVVGAFKRRVFVGEEGDLLRSGVVLTEEIGGLAPGGLLAAVEFAEVEVEDVALEDAAVVETPVFNHAPVEVLFTILEPFRATKKHDG